MLIHCLGPASLQAVRTFLYVVGQYQVKMRFKGKILFCGVDLTGLRQGAMEDCSEHGDVHVGSITRFGKVHCNVIHKAQNYISSAQVSHIKHKRDLSSA
jgi:hypothetical protein